MKKRSARKDEWSLKGEKNPMWGVKRPDTASRNVKGENHPSYKKDIPRDANGKPTKEYHQQYHRDYYARTSKRE